jgi:predicted nucleotidyltransferase
VVPGSHVAWEESYVREHRTLLSDLRAALRTERRVVAALLFGSVARGDDTPQSDVDLAVAIDGEHDLTDLHRLRTRLARKISRRVDLFDLDDLMLQPELLAGVLEDGRPLVDRAYVWPRLQAARTRLIPGLPYLSHLSTAK